MPWVSIQAAQPGAKETCDERVAGTNLAMATAVKVMVMVCRIGGGVVDARVSACAHLAQVRTHAGKTNRKRGGTESTTTQLYRVSAADCIATWQAACRLELVLAALSSDSSLRQPSRAVIDGQDSDRDEIGGRLQQRCHHIFKTGSLTALRTRHVLVD
jgi:hypothetical protein